MHLKNAEEMGRVVRHLRKKSGLSQSDLALRAGISRTALQNLEEGKKTLQLSTLFPVLDYLNARLYLHHSLFSEGNTE